MCKYDDDDTDRADQHESYPPSKMGNNFGGFDYNMEQMHETIFFSLYRIDCTLVTYYIQKKRKTFLVTTLRSSLNGAHSNFIFIIFHHLNQVKEVVLMVR